MAEEAKQKYSRSVGCPTSNYVLVVCKNKSKQYLSCNAEIPSFCLEHRDGYTQLQTAGTVEQRMKQQCGCAMNIRGILRIEHTEHDGVDATMRCIYYAEPDEASNKKLKLAKDAQWIGIPSKEEMAKTANNALFAWIRYLEYDKGIIYPLHVFTLEGEGVEIPDYSMPRIQHHQASYATLAKSQKQQVPENANNDNDEEKTQ